MIQTIAQVLVLLLQGGRSSGRRNGQWRSTIYSFSA